MATVPARQSFEKDKLGYEFYVYLIRHSEHFGPFPENVFFCERPGLFQMSQKELRMEITLALVCDKREARPQKLVVQITMGR